MADTPVNTAQEFLDTSFVEYSIEETIEHTTEKDKTGSVKHRFVFLVRTNTDDEKRIRIITSGTEGGPHEVISSETVTEAADQAESLATITVDSMAEAGQTYLEREYPEYTIREMSKEWTNHPEYGETAKEEHYLYVLENESIGDEFEVELTIVKLEHEDVTYGEGVDVGDLYHVYEGGMS